MIYFTVISISNVSFSLGQHGSTFLCPLIGSLPRINLAVWPKVVERGHVHAKCVALRYTSIESWKSTKTNVYLQNMTRWYILYTSHGYIICWSVHQGLVGWYQKSQDVLLLCSWLLAFSIGQKIAACAWVRNGTVRLTQKISTPCSINFQRNRKIKGTWTAAKPKHKKKVRDPRQKVNLGFLQVLESV